MYPSHLYPIRAFGKRKRKRKCFRVLILHTDRWQRRPRHSPISWGRMVRRQAIMRTRSTLVLALLVSALMVPGADASGPTWRRRRRRCSATNGGWCDFGSCSGWSAQCGQQHRTCSRSCDCPTPVCPPKTRTPNQRPVSRPAPRLQFYSVNPDHIWPSFCSSLTGCPL